MREGFHLKVFTLQIFAEGIIISWIHLRRLLPTLIKVSSIFEPPDEIQTTSVAACYPWDFWWLFNFRLVRLRETAWRAASEWQPIIRRPRESNGFNSQPQRQHLPLITAFSTRQLMNDWTEPIYPPINQGLTAINITLVSVSRKCYNGLNS